MWMALLAGKRAESNRRVKDNAPYLGDEIASYGLSSGAR
jgi:hypothetical protein